MKFSLSRIPISFVIIALFLGMFVGAVAGSLAYQVFGLELLNKPLGSTWRVAEDFYLIKRLEVQITPGSVLGLLITGWLIYRRSKS
ncbi:MAG: hypothetical protein HY042_03230 [Spirochaetia bacterium]|nr:hypothetical protein [Spirochaetia bacterium]